MAFLSVASFGRSFLDLRSRRVGTVRCAVRVLRAARRRWPDGRLVRTLDGLMWMVPGVDARDGSPCEFCGALVSTIRPGST